MKSALKIAAILATAALGLAALPASAAVILNFEAGTATPAGVGTVSVPIYLKQTLTAGSSSVFPANGLYSIGVAIARTGGTATITSFAQNPTFDQVNGGSVLATSASVNAQQNVNFPNGPVPDANGRILFATATIVQGLTSSTFSIGDFGPGDQTITYNFEALDSQISPGSFTVSAVPEPASLAALAGVGLVALRRRRR